VIYVVLLVLMLEIDQNTLSYFRDNSVDMTIYSG
jgi:hypothetical protein